MGWTFAQMPIWLITSADVTDGAKILFGYLKYRQGTDAACWPSKARIAKDLSISRDTVTRRIQELIDAGYVERIERKGRTNLYKLIADPNDEAGNHTPKNHDNDPTRDPSSDDDPPASMQGGRQDPPASMQGGPPRTDAPHDDSHEQESNNNYMLEIPDGSDPKENFGMLARICKIDLDTITPTQRGKLNTIEQLLRERKGVKTRDLFEFGLWWYKDWWQGQDGQPPRPMQIREQWGVFTAQRNAKGKKPEEKEGVLRV